MKYRFISYNASESNLKEKYLLRYKIQKQYEKNTKWYDVRFKGKIIPFKDLKIVNQIVNSLNSKNNG